MSYGDNHRFLLRLISSQSVMLSKDAKKQVERKAGNEVNIQDIVKEINDKLKPLKQEIRFVQDEVTTEEMIVFLSTGYDSTTKVQNVFSATELEFFRLLMERIMSIETREITEISALNLVNDIKVNNRNLNKTDAQNILGLWCRMQYLQKEENNYVLGVRAIHEFESYLLKNMPDVMEKCYICKKIVYRGYNCPSCAMAIHSRCLDAFLCKSKRWPCCKKEYIHSQLQQLRGQSSRLTQSFTQQTLDSTQELAPTQIMEPTQPTQDNDCSAETLVNSYDEMEIDESVASTSRRGKKRRRDP